MNDEKLYKLIKKIQLNENDSVSLMILWNEYKDVLYSSFLKYFFSKRYNIPLEKEDFISVIFLSFKKAIQKFNLENKDYHFLQYAHVATKSDAARYAKKFITKKENVMNNAFEEDKFEIKNLYKNSTLSLDEMYSNEFMNKHKLSMINYYLDIFIKKDPNSKIKEIINLKLRNYKTNEISSLLKIEKNKINYSINSFKKFINQNLDKNNFDFDL